MHFTLLVAWLISVFGAGSPAIANLDNQQIPILQYAYERAIDAGINPIKFIKLIHCESRIQEKAKGDYSKETGKFISQGILQFQKKTFDLFSKKYGLIDGEWLNPYSQINLASRMLKDGLWSQWYNCSKQIGTIKDR